MLGNKNHLLGIAILLIASVGLYYGTRTEEDKLASAMESAVEDHEREEALIYASKLLELQPGHPQAKRVIAQSVAIFTQIQAAREGLSEFWNRSDAAPLDAETLYRGLQESRKHLAKAKNIDAEFETTLEFVLVIGGKCEKSRPVASGVHAVGQENDGHSTDAERQLPRLHQVCGQGNEFV